MAVDPYVPTAPGWRAVRPGDLEPGAPAGRTGLLFGTPGPDSGYALRLAERFHDRVAVVAPETVHDAEAVAAQVAMRRGGLFGRAPVLADVEVGFTLFGWLGEPPGDLVEWRRLAVAGVGHDYARRIRLVEAIPESVIRHEVEEIRALVSDWRPLLGFDPTPASPGA